MEFRTRWFAWIGILFFPLISYSATFDFSVLGALTSSFYNYNDSLGTTVSRKQNFGGGATVGVELSPFLGAEAGLFYFGNSFALNTGGQTREDTFHFVDFTVLGRFVPISQIAFYLGPYYGIEAGTTTSDIGFMGGMGFRYALTSTLKIRIDGLYQVGLTNLDTVNSTQNSRNLILLVGLMFETW